jgi:hypothetical protein
MHENRASQSVSRQERGVGVAIALGNLDGEGDACFDDLLIMPSTWT